MYSINTYIHTCTMDVTENTLHCTIRHNCNILLRSSALIKNITFITICYTIHTVIMCIQQDTAVIDATVVWSVHMVEPSALAGTQ